MKHTMDFFKPTKARLIISGIVLVTMLIGLLFPHLFQDVSDEGIISGGPFFYLAVLLLAPMHLILTYLHVNIFLKSIFILCAFTVITLYLALCCISTFIYFLKHFLKQR